MRTVDPAVVALAPWGGFALGLLLLAFGLRAARRRRLIDDIPTSKTTGVFIGLVELKGTAEAEAPLTSYLAGAPCVHYAWSVDERWSKLVTETYRDSKGNTRTRTRRQSGWTRLADDTRQIPFYLRDDDGVVLVQPEGAKVEPATLVATTCGRFDALYYAKGPPGAILHSDHVRRFTETAVCLHAPLYVVGQAREREDVVAPEIAAAATAPLFLISTRSERQVSVGLAWTAWVLALLGLAVAVGVAVWATATAAAATAAAAAPMVEAPDGVPLALAARRAAGPGFLPPPVVAALAYLATWFLGWLWMAYNSLVELHQRVRQAWANVDVQLQRRADLIPALVRTVEGLRDYERTVLTEITRLRNQVAVTAPGQPGADPAACVPALRAVLERYPTLKANDAFMGLHHGLVETEQRLALARAYFNDIATFYNTRLQIVPDRWVAGLARLQPRALLGAEEFERAAVQVHLAD